MQRDFNQTNLKIDKLADMRKPCTAAWKFKVISRAKEIGNRAVARRSILEKYSSKSKKKELPAQQT